MILDGQISYIIQAGRPAGFWVEGEAALIVYKKFIVEKNEAVTIRDAQGASHQNTIGTSE